MNSQPASSTNPLSNLPLNGPALVDGNLNAENATAQILIVDDEAMNRAMLRAMVKRYGYRALETGDGSKVLNMIEDVELVLLDIVMPEMHGFDVLAELRKVRTAVDLPVIMVTANDDKEQILSLIHI